MEARTILSWHAKEREGAPKERSWYWAVGIMSGGFAVAAFILSNYLLTLIALLAGFSVMLAGSAKPRRHLYKLTEKGFMIDAKLIRYAQIEQFAIHENEDSKELLLETKGFSGTLSAPLGNADYRAIEMELKNHNIEEVESLHSFADHLAKGIGL